MNQPASLGRREANREATRTRIEDAILEVLASADGTRLNHDLLAERTGIARRTIYRYFPDQDALLHAAWGRVTALAGPNVKMPTSEAELLDSLEDVYTGFDRIAPLATVVRSTPQGRAVRLAERERRVASYTAAAADAVRDLPERDRVLATAVLQLLHTTAWLEMRDHWRLDGQEIARACGWAMRTLLADLRARNGRPLDEDAANDA